MLRKAKGKVEQEVDKPKPVKGRIWWKPTRDKKRTEFAGAYWPANLLNKTATGYEVRYDNGELETCKADCVFEEDHPCKFGAETVPFSAGEFVEVSNGSKSDPCAWLARIRSVGKDNKIMVEYPFHDTDAEQVKPALVRRARVPQGGDWLLIAPYQAWEDGQVLSPLDLELIPESQLAARLAAQPADLATSSEDGSAKPAARKRKAPADTAAEETASPRKRQRKSKPASTDDAVKAEPPSAAPAAAAAAAVAAPADKDKRRRKAAAVADAVEGSGEAAAAKASGSARRGTRARAPAGTAAAAAAGRSSAEAAGVKLRTALDFFGERNRAHLVHDNPAAAQDMALALMEAWKMADPMERAVCEFAEYMEGDRHLKATGQAPPNAGGASSSTAADPGAVKGRPAQVLFAIDFKKRIDYSKMDLKTGVALTEEAWRALPEGDKNKYAEAAELEQARCDRENAIRASILQSTRNAGLTAQQQQQAAEVAVLEDRRRLMAAGPAAAASPLPSLAQMVAAGGAAAGPTGGWSPSMAVNPMAMMALSSAMRAAFASSNGGPSGSGLATALFPPQALFSPQMMGPALAALHKVAALPASPAAAAAGPPPVPFGAPYSPAEVAAILNSGTDDLKAAKAGLAACGYGPGAYLLLLDAWREGSSRLGDALRAYATHVRGVAEPDWDAFMVHMYGLERMAGLKSHAPQALHLGGPTAQPAAQLPPASPAPQPAVQPTPDVPPSQQE